MKRLLTMWVTAGLLIVALGGCGTSATGPESPVAPTPIRASELTVTATSSIEPTITGSGATATQAIATPTTASALATPTRASAPKTPAAPPAATTPSPVTTRTSPSATPTATAAATSGPESLAIPEVHLIPAFPGLPADAFGSRPLFFAEIPDGSDRAVVVDQGGKMFVLRLDAATRQATVFLDLSARVSTAGNEEGLLGLAFDADFQSNREFFVYYSAANPRRSMLSRFRVSADPDVADPASEQVVMEIPQPFANHNGGMLAFGPDGYLYVGLGDGGSGGDPSGNGQNLATLLGSILRIDVSGTKKNAGSSYAVPSDNPFVGRPEAEARHEIWAFGLRNPWRFSFDLATGDLWAGDVGQNSWEEIDLILKGANYGWNVMEGGHCFRGDSCDQSGLVTPLAEYRTGQFGCAVTGGYVYRGNEYPSLRGVYLYADYCSGLIWGLRFRNGKVVAGPKLVAETGRLIPSFAEDRDGELYVTSFGGAGQAPGVFRVVLR